MVIALTVYLVVAVVVGFYHGNPDIDYSEGRCVCVGLLWPLLLVRNLVAEAYRIIRG